MSSYNLYAGRIPQTLPSEKYTYIPYNRNYILVYTANDLTANGYSIVPETIKLSTDEREWLINAKLQINAEALRQRKEELIEFFNKKLDELERSK